MNGKTLCSFPSSRPPLSRTTHDSVENVNSLWNKTIKVTSRFLSHSGTLHCKQKRILRNLNRDNTVHTLGFQRERKIGKAVATKSAT